MRQVIPAECFILPLFVGNGIADDHIIRIDLEDRMNKDLRNPDMMLHYVHDRIKDKELYYIIIDEVQLMDEFVDVLNSFRHIEMPIRM